MIEGNHARLTTATQRGGKAHPSGAIGGGGFNTIFIDPDAGGMTSLGQPGFFAADGIHIREIGFSAESDPHSELIQGGIQIIDGVRTFPTG